MAPLDPSTATTPTDNSEAISVDWSTMSYLLDDDEDDDQSVFIIQMPKKRVRIAPEPRVLQYVQPLSEMTEEERLRGWWQKDEYEATKASAKTKCRELRKKGNKKCLTDAYEQACIIAEGEGDFSASIRNLQPTKHLIDWCSCDDAPRGLERWSSKLHAFRRNQHVKEVKHAVMLEQAKQLFSNDKDDEKIAQVAQAASKRAKAFARLLGLADHVAVEDSGRKRRPSKMSGSPVKAITLDEDDSRSSLESKENLERPRKTRKPFRDVSPVDLNDILSKFDEVANENPKTPKSDQYDRAR